MPTLRSMRHALGHMDPLLIDGITVVILFALMAAQFVDTRHLQTGQHPATVLTWLLAVLIVGPILTHRRFPLASVGVCLAAVAVYATGHYVAYPGLAVFVLTFDIALHRRERIALATLFASAAVIWVSVSLQPGTVAVAATYVESELGILVAWLIGRNLRHRRARWAELASRAERLEREREEQARRAVTEERLRIARELHDVIAHSMSVIAVQSAVGNHVIDSQPASQAGTGGHPGHQPVRAHRDAPPARRAAAGGRTARQPRPGAGAGRPRLARRPGPGRRAQGLDQRRRPARERSPRASTCPRTGSSRRRSPT